MFRVRGASLKGEGTFHSTYLTSEERKRRDYGTGKHQRHRGLSDEDWVGYHCHAHLCNRHGPRAPVQPLGHANGYVRWHHGPERRRLHWRSHGLRPHGHGRAVLRHPDGRHPQGEDLQGAQAHSRHRSRRFDDWYVLGMLRDVDAAHDRCQCRTVHLHRPGNLRAGGPHLPQGAHERPAVDLPGRRVHRHAVRRGSARLRRGRPVLRPRLQPGDLDPRVPAEGHRRRLRSSVRPVLRPLDVLQRLPQGR